MFWLGQVGLVVLTLAAAITALAPGKVAKQRSRILATVAFSGGLLASLVLAVVLATEDWRFSYAVGHTRPGIGWPLQVAGLWAGPEGSLLLWTTMLAVATIICARLATTVWSTRLLASLTAGYGVALLTVSYPFERLAAPPGTGNGLQPVLEHPAMVWHPPILYLGLIGLLVPVAWILGSTIESALKARGSEDPDEVIPDTVDLPLAVGPALLLALAVLTAGLATGSNWAYVELGWGGYWAWDPIENAGLVAWLGAASMLHRFTATAQPADDRVSTPTTTTLTTTTPTPTTYWMAAATGAAVIWATTITRTGVLNSVHAFADQPALRAVLLFIASVFTATVLTAAFLGSRSAASIRRRPPMRSREAVAVILIAAVVVAVGTYEPAIEAAVRDNPFTLSGRYYSVLLWPLAVVGAAARIWSTVKRGHQRSSLLLGAAVVGGIVAMIIVGASVGPFGLGLAASGGAVVSVSLVDATMTRSPSWVTHLGLGLLLIGIAGTIASTRTTVVALLDQQAETAVGTVVHRGIEIEDRPGTTQGVATVELTPIGGDKDGSGTQRFQPRLVRYIETGGSSAEVDTDRGWLTDTQVVLIDGDSQQATYRISRHPRISFVWLGSLVTIVGLVLSARFDLSLRKRAPGPTTQQPARQPHASTPEPRD